MAEVRGVLAAHMAALIQGLGCYDAAAETIAARWGASISRGTLTKKLNGVLDWTVADVIALEDARGQYPVTRLLWRRMRGRGTLEDGSLLQDGSTIARESGEAIAAILRAEQSSATGAGASDAAQAIKELDEAIAAMRIARARLEGLAGAQA